ncbi:hypothetical protein ACFOGI_13230 [Virgibacillus xinjiangensis]|uniref:Heat induced stress protein YflT n=1 Tax=Virgibacillus xinjiangensis TaxID=393090 RepID=A0ABV7CYY4_9BACI
MEPIQAYFKSENDAEAAKADLQRLKTERVMVDSIPEDQKDASLIPINNPGAGAGTVGVVGSGEAGISTEEREKEFTHIVEGEVEEREYEQALNILKRHKGYQLKD